MSSPSVPRAPLPPEVLARRERLPLKPDPVTLVGASCRVEPLALDPATLAALHAASCGSAFTLGGRHIDAYDADARIWRFMSGGPFATVAALEAWLAPQVDARDGRAFVVRDGATGAPVGVINLMANSPAHLKVELGAIWYSPIVQGAGVSREVVGLMSDHVFGLGYRRVEWKCDALNEASRRAALSYGFRFEGIQEAHYIIKGRNRDTAWYRLLHDEWAGAAAGPG